MRCRILKPWLKLLVILTFVMNLIMGSVSASPVIFKDTWRGVGIGKGSSWSLQPGKVSWNSNKNSVQWLLTLKESKGNLKFSKAMQTSFEFWFVNSDEFSGEPDSIAEPAVVISGDVSGPGSTPNLIVNNRVSLGYGDTSETVSTCKTSASSNFECLISINFSQYGGTISNYESGDVIAYASFKSKTGLDDQENVLAFFISAEDFPGDELRKTSSNSISNKKNSNSAVTYTNKPGGTCNKVGQIAQYTSGNLECQKVGGRYVWVQATGTTATKNPLNNRALPKCTSVQIANLQKIADEYGKYTDQLNTLKSQQQELRDEIEYKNNYGIYYDRKTYQNRIDVFDKSIRNYTNKSNALVIKFNSINSVCKNSEIVLE